MCRALCSAGVVLCALAVSAATPAPSTLADRHAAHHVSCEGCHGNGPKKAVEMMRCFQCHKSYAAVAERTKDLKPNPHDSHLVDLECNVCHHGHKPFELYCNTCHIDMNISRTRK
ncbi:MAG: cytochrome c3 family protein [Syntrophorhabdales bacterium]